MEGETQTDGKESAQKGPEEGTGETTTSEPHRSNYEYGSHVSTI